MAAIEDNAVIPWRYIMFAAVLTAICAVLGCSGSSETNRPGGEIEPATSAVSVPQSTGVLEGRVLFEGEDLPRVTQIENTTDPDHCGKIHSLENVIVSPDNRGVQNAVVTLGDLPLPEGYEPPHTRLVLDNRHCRFEPHVAVLTVGSTIEAMNSDPFYHSVHLYGLKQLNVSLSASRSKLIKLPNRPGYLIVKCDVHGWMQAYIRVDRHPFHAVTDAAGRFRIEGVPTGSHAVEIWHEHFGPQKRRVSVEPNTTSEITISYANQTKDEKP